MKKSNSGMHGHGMPIKTKGVEPHKPLQPNGSEMPTKESVTTTIHESKHFPFQIVEQTITNNETKEEVKQFKVACAGSFMSDKVFKDFEKTEKYIASRPWELITNLICITLQNALEYEKTKSKH